MARSFGKVRSVVLVSLLLAAAFFATRLFNLTILPIFTDEAIYIRWSQIGSRDAAWRFISLVDGKQPMFTWIMMVLLKLVHDPLVAGRLVSVLAGAASMVGIWFLSFELFKSRKVSFLTTGLYLLTPFTLMYDRLAVYDSLVGTFFIWSVFLSVLLVRHLRLDIALILGMVLGAGMLNKSSGFLSLYMLPATLILFDWKKPNVRQRLLQWLSLALVAAVVSQAMYAVLRLSPLFHMVRQKDVVFIYSFQEWLIHPFKFVSGNLKGLFDWAVNYLTWPIFAAAMVGFLQMGKKWRESLLLITWWFAPFFALSMFGRVLYPRFILFMIMPLLVLAARALLGLIEKKNPTGIILFVLVVLPSLWTNYFILTNPKYAPIPFSDKSQLIDDWPSGWGVREVNEIITREAQKGKVTIYTEGTFGLMPYAIEMYQIDNPNVEVRGVWPVPQELTEDMLADAKDHTTFILFNQTQTPPDWSMELVGQYQKGNREDVWMRIYRIQPL